jgi:hypothetical protein
MPDDYREIDDRYDRMTEIVRQGNADRAQQEDLVRRRNEAGLSSGGSTPVSFSGFFKTIIGCAMLLVRSLSCRLRYWLGKRHFCCQISTATW